MIQEDTPPAIRQEPLLHIRVARAMLYETPVSPFAPGMSEEVSLEERAGFEKFSHHFKSATRYSVIAIRSMREPTTSMAQALVQYIQSHIVIDDQGNGSITDQDIIEAYRHAIDDALLEVLAAANSGASNEANVRLSPLPAAQQTELKWGD